MADGQPVAPIPLDTWSWTKTDWLNIVFLARAARWGDPPRSMANVDDELRRLAHVAIGHAPGLKP